MIDQTYTVTTQGSNLNAAPGSSLDLLTRVLTVEAVNTAYLAPFEFMYINIAGVINPGQTQPTATFAVTLLDSSNLPIEFIDNGVYFTATSGGFSYVLLTADNPYINE